jgi:hypothetical protein
MDDPGEILLVEDGPNDIETTMGPMMMRTPHARREAC